MACDLASTATGFMGQVVHGLELVARNTHMKKSARRRSSFDRGHVTNCAPECDPPPGCSVRLALDLDHRARLPQAPEAFCRVDTSRASFVPRSTP